MVSLQKKADTFDIMVLEIVGLSTDTKPLNSTGGISGQIIINGSTYFEMNTSKVFIFDHEGDVWLEI